MPSWCYQPKGNPLAMFSSVAELINTMNDKLQEHHKRIAFLTNIPVALHPQGFGARCQRWTGTNLARDNEGKWRAVPSVMRGDELKQIDNIFGNDGNSVPDSTSISPRTKEKPSFGLTVFNRLHHTPEMLKATVEEKAQILADKQRQYEDKIIELMESEGRSTRPNDRSYKFMGVAHDFMVRNKHTGIISLTNEVSSSIEEVIEFEAEPFVFQLEHVYDAVDDFQKLQSGEYLDNNVSFYSLTARLREVAVKVREAGEELDRALDRIKRDQGITSAASAVSGGLILGGLLLAGLATAPFSAGLSLGLTAAGQAGVFTTAAVGQAVSIGKGWRESAAFEGAQKLMQEVIPKIKQPFLILKRLGEVMDEFKRQVRIAESRKEDSNAGREGEGTDGNGEVKRTTSGLLFNKLTSKSVPNN